MTWFFEFAEHFVYVIFPAYMFYILGIVGGVTLYMIGRMLWFWKIYMPCIKPLGEVELGVLDHKPLCDTMLGRMLDVFEGMAIMEEVMKMFAHYEDDQ